ncbi:MAG: M64 family metallopeptidase [Acidobacteriota bacterium]|jgi:hypothetical protein
MNLAILLLPLLLECPALSEAHPCPQVHPVQLADDPGQAIDVLFLGDGFLEEELDDYRCAVQRILGDLLAASPFQAYACRLNVYRIDLASDGSIDQGGSDCPELEPMEEVSCAVSDAGDPIGADTGAPECATLDLHTRFGYDDASCELLWLDADEQSVAADLGFCTGGDIRAVIILANSGTYGGGASSASWDGIPIAVFAPEQLTEGKAWWMLAHELGHALFGLLDEYGSGGSSTYVAGRNIASEGEATGDSFLWSDACTDGDCDVICAGEAGDVVDDPVELFEGGFYHTCGYYRSMRDCRMASPSQDSCRACELTAAAAMAEMGLTACSE